MLEEWCENTSLNGVIDLWIYRKHRCRFCIWLTIMIFMFVVTVYMTGLNLYSFLNAPTVINIGLIASNMMEMPELLLCYQGGFNVVSMKHHGLSDDLIRVFRGGYWGSVANVDYEQLYGEYKNFVASNKLSTESFLTDVAGFKCNDVVKERRLAGDTVTNYGCANVSEFIGKGGSPCWVFRNNGQQLWPTPSDGGIRLRLKLPLGAVITNDSEREDPFETPPSFSLVIEKRVLIATDQSIDIPMNYKVNILMSLTISKLLPTSSKDKCIDDEIFTTSNACYQRCLNVLTLNACNCTFPGMSHPTLDQGMSMCDIFSYKILKCSQLANVSSYECTMHCRPMCTEYQYQITLSYLPVMNKIQTEGSSVVTVSFSHMHYTQVMLFQEMKLTIRRIEEVDAFTWDLAVANVGGQAGLWLGCSIVTVIQALYYFGLSFCKTTKTKKLIQIDEVNVKH